MRWSASSADERVAREVTLMSERSLCKGVSGRVSAGEGRGGILLGLELVGDYQVRVVEE